MPDPITQKVNGPARIRVGAQEVEAAGTEYLGLSADGVRILIQPNVVDVATDASGPTPADVQAFPEIAFITFRLVAWASDVLEDFLSTTIAGFTWLPGQTLPPGIMLGANNSMKTIRIESPYGDDPWHFPFCHFHQAPKELKVGTNRTEWSISLRAIPGIGTNSDPGGWEDDNNLCVLYERE